MLEPRQYWDIWENITPKLGFSSGALEGRSQQHRAAQEILEDKQILRAQGRGGEGHINIGVAYGLLEVKPIFG
jgi:hypothetical protein